MRTCIYTQISLAIERINTMNRKFLALFLVFGWLTNLSTINSQEPPTDIADEERSLEMVLLETEMAVQAKQVELDKINESVSELSSRLDDLNENELDSLLQLYEQEEQSRAELETLEKELMDLQEAVEAQAQKVAGAIIEGQDVTLNEIGMEFVWIETMKCWVGRYEVTNSEYRFYNPEHSSGVHEGHNLDGDRQPVVRVSYEEAQAFAKWLTTREHESGRLPSEWIFRLPTSEEWAKIAECGENDRKYPWGNVWPPLYGNYDDDTSLDEYVIEDYNDNWIVSCPVEDSGCNNWGLCGVGGNVLEWTSQVKKEGFVVRGASWEFFRPYTLECKFYSVYPPRIQNESLGFRLFLTR